MRKIICRPEPEKIPLLALPIHVRSTGYNEADPGWCENIARREKPFVQIFWTVQGEGEFTFENRPTEKVATGDVIYRMPGEVHNHRSTDKKTPWHYYWFTFDGVDAERFMGSYHYPQKAMHAGNCPVKLFMELELLLKQRTLYAQRHAISVAAEILALAGNVAAEQEHDLTKRFLALVEANFSDPELTINDIAQELGIHRTTLGRIIKKHISESPKQYLNKLRLQKAVSLLKETDMSIKSIAYAVGINKVDYFCAMIRSCTGLTPVKYRIKTSADSL